MYTKTVSKQYQLLITGPEFHLGTQLDQAQLQLLLKAIMIQADLSQNSDPAKAQEEKLASFNTPTSGGNLSNPVTLSSYFEQAKVKRIPDKITTCAHYLKVHKNQNFFTKRDIVLAFEQAMETLPKNLSRDLAWAEKIGWIAQSKEQAEAYYLTRTGQEAVQAQFPSELRKKTSIHNLK